MKAGYLILTVLLLSMISLIAIPVLKASQAPTTKVTDKSLDIDGKVLTVPQSSADYLYVVTDTGKLYRVHKLGNRPPKLLAE